MNASLHSTGEFLTKVSILFITMIISAAAAFAGTGDFKPDGNGGGVFNFCVSLRFNATQAQLTLIENAFRDGSQILADATDGRHRFGTINIVNNDTSSAEDA